MPVMFLTAASDGFSASWPRVFDGWQRLFLPEFYEAGQLVNQGTALLRSNQNKEAADKLSRAVLIAPGMAEAHHDYALALAKLGQTQPALDQFKLALNLNPNLDSAWLSMGGLYQSTGNIPCRSEDV